MEGMEEWLVELVKSMVEEVNGQVAVVDRRLEQQGSRIEEMKMKVTMSMELIGKVQQEQLVVAKAFKGMVPPQLMIPPRDEAGILVVRPREVQIHPPPPPASPSTSLAP